MARGAGGARPGTRRKEHVRVLLATPIPARTSLQHRSHYPHLGLASIAASLLERGATVEVFDGSLATGQGEWTDRVAAFRPHLVGLSAFTCQVKAAHELALLARRAMPGAEVVVGGPHPTACPDGTLDEFPGFDYAVAGEGEEAMCRLAEAAGRRGAQAAIPGLVFRDGGRVVVNPQGPPLDMDRLPLPAWHLFDLKRCRSTAFLSGAPRDGTQSFRVETTRGCPFGCTFCSRVLGRRVRHRSVPRVIDEIRSLQRLYGADSIAFAANTFTVDRAYTLELCRALADLEKGVQWFCSTRVDCLDPELMAAMRRAGCDSIEVGIECGSQEVLDAVRKGTRVDSAWEVVRELKRLGFTVMSNFILGLPADTPRTIVQTIELAVALDLDYATFTLFTPFPGAPLTRTLMETPGVSIVSRDWDDYDTQAPRYLVARPGLPGWTVDLLHKWAYARFYLRPAHVWKLGRIVTPGSVGGYAKQALRTYLAGRAT
jgi:radical SAM superfamily enzyme YgiQ (UPF0313 family)